MNPTKFVFLIDEVEEIEEYANSQDSILNLLGGKGTRLVEMNRLRLPIPPAFVITTEACWAYLSQKEFPQGLWEQVLEGLHKLEQRTGRKFGDSKYPLIVSARSGAKISMPGMLDSVPNLGLNDRILEGLIHLIGDQRFGYDTYRLLISEFGEIVMGVNKRRFDEVETHYKQMKGTESNLGILELKKIVKNFKDIIKQETGTSFPSAPDQQLKAAIKSVFESWNKNRAVKYRNERGISHDLGTAVTIQTMVFGNAGPNSGTGVVFSRNQITGENELYGEYRPNAQGTEIVSGTHSVFPIRRLARDNPEAYERLEQFTKSLERHYKAVPDIEFTIEKGNLWLLQSRNAKPQVEAAVKIAVDMVHEGLLDVEGATKRIVPGDLDSLIQPKFDPKAKEHALTSGKLLAKGIPATSGAAVGRVYFDIPTAQAQANQGKSVILVRPDANPDEAEGFSHAKGIVTSRGGATSHAALIARELNRPCVVGCDVLLIDVEERTFTVDSRVIREGDVISIDGRTGEIFLGEITTIPPKVFPELQEFLLWSRGRSVWANAVSSEDTQKAEALRSKAGDIMVGSRWVTEKAQVVELLGEMIPEPYIIRQVVVDARDQVRLHKLMLEAVTKGYWNGPRTCYYPDAKLGKARWQMAMETEEDVERFIRDRNYRLGTRHERRGAEKAGGYPAWIEDEHLREIIIPFDPPKKGLPEFEDEHFVAAVSCLSNPNTVLIEMNLGTAQLRSIEGVKKKGLIHISLFLDPDSPDLRGLRSFIFGQRYFKSKELDSIMSVMTLTLNHLDQIGTGANEETKVTLFKEFINNQLETASKAIKDICYQMYQVDPDLTTEQVNIDAIASRIVEVMRTPDFTAEMYEQVVEPKALRIARAVSFTVFDEWWHPPFELPLIMQALHEAAGLQILEIQGHINPDETIDYILVYGAKGREESSATAKLGVG